MKLFSSLSQRAGFTLVELLIAITILGLLAVITSMNIAGALKRGGDAKAMADIKDLSAALEIYYSVNNSYPGDLTGLEGSKRYLSTGKVPTPNDQYTYSYASLNGNEDYCLCANLVKIDGNATDSDCSDDGSTKDYFCVENAQ